MKPVLRRLSALIAPAVVSSIGTVAEGDVVLFNANCIVKPTAVGPVETPTDNCRLDGCPVARATARRAGPTRPSPGVALESPWNLSPI